ncbi:MAG: C40 family peptidase [Planctomycetes bacterium]|nr:C40 family peptidase [Planctomycetota bacterium]
MISNAKTHLFLLLLVTTSCHAPNDADQTSTGGATEVVPYSWPAGKAVDAVVRVSVAPLRSEPRHGAEQVDQVILGTTLQVLETRSGFARVRTPYDYEGWIPINLTTDRTDANASYWNEHALQRFERSYGVVRSRPDASATPVCDLVLGARMALVKHGDTWSHVRLPDGREGFVSNAELHAIPDGTQPDVDRLVRRALELQGVPYLWGGHSSKGFDCSGFTRTLYALEGVSLLRDARQQVTLGEPIEPTADFANVHAGDLLFFGSKPDRITHVALSLGGPRFVHCAGDVHVRSLDEQAPDFDRGRRNTLQAVRRIVP